MFDMFETGIIHVRNCVRNDVVWDIDRLRIRFRCGRSAFSRLAQEYRCHAVYAHVFLTISEFYVDMDRCGALIDPFEMGFCCYTFLLKSLRV